MVRSAPSRSDKPRRRCPKRCNMGIYHTGAFLLFIGIVVAIVGMGTARLFQIYLYDHRKPAGFLHVDIPVGLFSLTGQVTHLSLEQECMKYELQLSDSRWTWAKLTCVFGVLAACIAMLQHLIMACLHDQQSWIKVGIELFVILFAVCMILIGLSLAECEIEYIHDDGDPDLSRFLANNGLLRGANKSKHSNASPTLLLDPTVTHTPILATATSTGETLERGDMALYVTPPQSGFHALVAADFLLLLAFLAVLIRFVRLCEKSIRERRRLHHGSLIVKE